MRWIFDNPQLLLVIAGAVAYWLTQRRQQKELKREAEEELGRVPTDDEMAERTRRIQEEIRRKIAERMGQPSYPEPSYAEEERWSPEAPPLPPAYPTTESPRPPPLVAVAEAGTGAAELERVMEQQRRYAEQLQQLESLSRTAPTAQNLAAASAFAAGGAALPPIRLGLGLMAGLRDRDALRQAVLLREILGPAKGLQ